MSRAARRASVRRSVRSDGESSAASILARMKASIGDLTQEWLCTWGSRGRAGAIKDQWARASGSPSTISHLRSLGEVASEVNWDDGLDFVISVEIELAIDFA